MCDPVAHRAEQVASQLKARPMEGFRAVAACEDVDAVMLLSARWFGALPILAACDHGKAVYCGASVNLQANQASHLRDRVRQAGIAFMAEFPKRLAPATTRLKELIATRLGPPRLIFCNERYASRGDQGDGPANMRRLVEMVDWCCYVAASRVRSVTGMAYDPLGRQEDPGEQCSEYSLMTLEYEPSEKAPRGVMAQIGCGSYVPTRWTDAAAFRRPAEMQVVCERGIAFLDLPNRLVWFNDAGQHTEALDEERPVGEQLLMQFHRSVSSLVLQTAGLDDAYQAARLVIAARQGCQEGRRIEL